MANSRSRRKPASLLPARGHGREGVSRRSFLRRSAAAAAASSLSLGMLLKPRTAHADSFGPLVPDPDGVLDLPEGFSYRILQRMFDDMSDGYRVPGYADGMACFAGAGNTWVLLRNHELEDADVDFGPYKNGQAPPAEAYTENGQGGVTRVVVDRDTLEVVSSNLVLVGTSWNCCGGPSPWGWLSCEEDTDDGHGHVFVCPADAESVQTPQRIDGYGRFVHEAVAIDPETNVAYLTEDRGDSCFYRFVPDAKDAPFVGTLQALKVVGEDRLRLARGHEVGDSWQVEWVDVEDPASPRDTIRSDSQALGAAVLSRGEGIWYAEGTVYICSTDGGPIEKGQIFAFDIAAQTLTLIAQSTDERVLDNPDNITVAPWGDVFMAEDGDGDQYIRFIDATGAISDFARNAVSGSEFAGVCFSPDGQTLFVNIQKNGLTLAVSGNFPRVDVPPDDGGTGDPGGDDPPGGGDDPGDGGTPGGGDDTEVAGGCATVDPSGLSIGSLAIVGAAVGAVMRLPERSEPAETPAKAAENDATQDELKDDDT